MIDYQIIEIKLKNNQTIQSLVIQKNDQVAPQTQMLSQSHISTPCVRFGLVVGAHQ